MALPRLRTIIPPQLYTYDAARVTLWFGTIPIVSFADRTFVEVERERKVWRTEVGVDGEVIRVGSKKKNGRFTFYVMQAGVENDLLSGAMAIDEETGRVILPTAMRDGNGRTLAFGARSWLAGWPKVSRAAQADQPVQWEIECDLLRVFVGGHVPQRFNAPTQPEE